MQSPHPRLVALSMGAKSIFSKWGLLQAWHGCFPLTSRSILACGSTTSRPWMMRRAPPLRDSGSGLYLPAMRARCAAMAEPGPLLSCKKGGTGVGLGGKRAVV